MKKWIWLLLILAISLSIFSVAYANEKIQLEKCFQVDIPSYFSKFYTGGEWSNDKQEYNSSEGSTTVTITRKWGGFDVSTATKDLSLKGFSGPKFDYANGTSFLYSSRENDNWIMWAICFGTDDGSLNYYYIIEVDGRKSQTWGRRNTQETVEMVLETAGFHHYVVTMPRQEPKCTESGYESYQYCWNCGMNITERVPIDPIGHQWDEGTVIQEPTCEEPGIMLHTCLNDPSHTKEEEIPEDPDKHSWTAAFRWSPDYSQATAVIACEYCQTTHEIPAETSSALTRESSCTAPGIITHTATAEFESKTFIGTTEQELEMKAHQLVSVAAVKPTVTKKGTEAYWYCSVCQHLFSDPEGKDEISKPVKIPKLEQISISKATVSEIPDKVFTGKALKPKFTVTYNDKKLVADKDYTIAWKNNTEIGKATITLTGKGLYKGTKKITFLINPKAVKLSFLKAGKNKLTVKWKKGSGIDGYEIEYSLKKSFQDAQKVSVSPASTVKTQIEQLKKGKTWYVRIRTYKKVGSKKYYSEWSKPLSQKAK